jgi:hypothetical protein
MTDETPLDAARAAMEARPDDDAARMRFYGLLADTELFLLLADEAAGDTISPRVFDPQGERCVLAFDLEERLAQFSGLPVPYAALPGRAFCAMLDGQGIALGINLGVAPSSILLPPEAVTWLAQTLGQAPAEMTARPEAIGRPDALPQALLSALGDRLARVGGVAQAAWLVGVRYGAGDAGHMLAFVDAAPSARPALARMVSEALTFSDAQGVRIDVSFVAGGDAVVAVLARHGLRFDLPAHRADNVRPLRPAPGSDPDKPPKLR